MDPLSSPQTKITKFFSPSQRPRCKRKILQDDSPLVEAVSPVKLRRPCLSPVKSKLVLKGPTVSAPSFSPVKSGPQLTSPVKSRPFLSPIKTPLVVNSPSKAKLCLSPTKSLSQLSSPSKSKSSTDFSLPTHYQTLSKIFDAMDNVFSLLIRSNRQLTFDKLKSGVESMAKKTFDHIKLAQIKTLYPECISYSFENVTNAGRTSKVLIVRPTKLSNPSDPKSPLIPVEESELISSSRSKEFTKRLYDLAKKHHQQFLSSTYPALRVDHSKLVCWHHEFKVNSIPPIPYDEEALPPIVKPAGTSAETSLLAMMRAKAANKALLDSPSRTPSSPSSGEKAASGKVESGPLKGISLALLNKVKAREAEKIAREMTRPAEVQKKISMLRQFGELVRIVKFYFVGEKKNVLPIEQVAKKMVDSYRAFMSPADAVERLEFMAKSLPHWIGVLKVKQGTFVKLLDAEANLSELQKRVDKLLDDMERGISVSGLNN